MSKVKNTIGISTLSYYLPPTRLSVDNLHVRRALNSSKENIRELGFNYVYVVDKQSSYDLAHRAVSKLLRNSKTDPQEIDILLYSNALVDRSFDSSKSKEPINLFQYPATLLQYKFGMQRANAMGISQAGCVSFLNTLRVARDMIIAEPSINKVLCVSADVLPTNKREVLYNLISDGSCAAVVERKSPHNHLISYAQVTKGFYWDSKTTKNELVASYFPTAVHVINDALKKANLTISDIKLIIPHNVSRKSWSILLNLLGASLSQFFGDNIKKKGHTIAADNIINLQDALEKGLIRKGDYVMLFTFGFGAHWACSIIQH
jgi:3-oxoacyl-[acyl-carrier-protein] synthase-3